ncbi:hypothetical protein BDN70DRAFT_995886 [Pholiota conissans]|uniref:Phytanoyl-CoA dioxygenase n=1 Tax=Pholiota conissans TaxID=109636 RepID=A0A9P6CXZ6_9AGAR|nr:hypothetical protein BDN70DRAFT_995886 [Pholiota conissans]
MGLKSLYETQGYVVVPNLIPSEDRAGLEKAVERVVRQTRDGSWPHRRTVGRQFPPYDNDNPDSWGVQHLMHPDLKEPTFVKWYTSSAFLQAVMELLECKESDLQMELLNLLINPVSHDFALRWHRDDISEDVSPEEEQRALNNWQYGVQWNTALYTDSCLFVVPRSHKIPRTEEQRKLSSGQILENALDMPGSICLVLQPGETVFYNNNILHCGAYNSKQPRATLHGCMGDIKAGVTRARNILQHGLEWMKGDAFRQTLPPELATSFSLKN